MAGPGSSLAGQLDGDKSANQTRSARERNLLIVVYVDDFGMQFKGLFPGIIGSTDSYEVLQ